MKTHDLCLVAEYEIKQQSRSWLFRFFLLLSLVGIVAGHVYWQGWGNSDNWKMVALPCSMPLMNAYLFGLIQSLFLIVMMADVPRRLFRQGAQEGLSARPVDNVTYYWGVVLGNLALFLLVNIVVITLSVLAVNLASLAPVSLKCYLFYLLTLTIPSWLFIGGLTLWLSYLFGSRVLAMVIPLCWLVGSIFWFPYHLHGTLDYLASGIPNLFSDIVGHVNLSGYLWQRLIYLLLGSGFLVLCVNKIRRLPNEMRGLRMNYYAGIVLVLMGLGCGLLLEYSYYRNRQVRADYKASFERNWKEKTCRVSRNTLTLEQQGERLKMQSKLVVYNPGQESLDQVVLFLNPGLRVTSLQSEGNNLSYWRDNQFILIDRSLEAGDSLRVEMVYEGKIDDRFCDLHLTDSVYEDPFHDDRFFATGRQGAFIGKNFLLLTPASAWYPVAIPPVNPFMPVATGRDFTRFKLEVQHPLQGTLVSQGQMSERNDAVIFTCSRALKGISLCGANYEYYRLPEGESFGLQFGSAGWDKRFVKSFSKVKQSDVIALWKDYVQAGNSKLIDNCRTFDWYEPKNPYLYFLEVPVSFCSDSHSGKPENGLVEPGMVFWRERGFDMRLAGAMAVGTIEDKENLSKVIESFRVELFYSSRRLLESHPLLDIGKKKIISDLTNNENDASSLGKVQPIRVYSSEYPFIGKFFDMLVTTDFEVTRGAVGSMIGNQEENLPFIGRSLIDIWAGNENVLLWNKLDDLCTRLQLAGISRQELRQSLDSLYRYRDGEVDYDALMHEWNVRWGVDVAGVMVEWLTTKHEHYFRVKDAVRYFDPVAKRFKMEGKIMNVGNSSGVVSIECGNFFGLAQRSVCRIEPGEAKTFTLVADQSASCINTGLSANRPAAFFFEQSDPGVLEKPWELMEKWRSIPVSEFMKEDNPHELIVDDQDAGFEIKDGRDVWFRRWRKIPTRFVGAQTQIGGYATYWQRVVDPNACGDAVRGYHYISGGSGESTATWRVRIPEAGRYQVKGKVYRIILRPSVIVRASSLPIKETPFDDSGVVYYYTLSFGNRQVEAEVSLDEKLSDFSDWIPLGEYDFPAGEVSVTLSNKEIKRRKEIAIVADAVKFVKLE